MACREATHAGSWYSDDGKFGRPFLCCHICDGNDLGCLCRSYVDSRKPLRDQNWRKDQVPGNPHNMTRDFYERPPRRTELNRFLILSASWFVRLDSRYDLSGFS